MGQFHWDPERYPAMIREEVPDYDRLQAELTAATGGIAAQTILELGTGSGETSRRVLEAHPGAELVGIDASTDMLAAAHDLLAGRSVTLRAGRLEDPLPPGPFDLVVSALTVHHLDALDKAELFERVAGVIRPGGRFVLADVVVPADPADAVTPIDDGFDRPGSTEDQVRWLRAAGFETRIAWAHRDLAVLAADHPADPPE